jgi:hypothetical protein
MAATSVRAGAKSETKPTERWRILLAHEPADLS